MRTISLALAVTAAPAIALACDSPPDSNSATLILQDGGTTRLIESMNLEKLAREAIRAGRVRS